MGITTSIDHNFHLKTVAVEAATFMRLREVRKEMSGFELVGFS